MQFDSSLVPVLILRTRFFLFPVYNSVISWPNLMVLYMFIYPNLLYKIAAFTSILLSMNYNLTNYHILLYRYWHIPCPTYCRSSYFGTTQGRVFRLLRHARLVDFICSTLSQHFWLYRGGHVVLVEEIREPPELATIGNWKTWSRWLPPCAGFELNARMMIFFLIN